MKHFLITRFNIKSDVWLYTKSGALTQTKSWLNQRFNLFETYCLPSVKNQSNQDFKWLIVFDINTPKEFKKRIEDLSKSYSNIIVLFTESFQTLKSTLNKAILSELTLNDKFIISTRLDNDDAVHKDFTNQIQQNYISQHNTIIDITKGYQLIVNTNNIDIRKFTSNYNPFISLIEDISLFETVMAKNHEHWKTLPNRVILNNSPLWIQVIHNDNVLNNKISILKKVYQIDFKYFGLNNLYLERNKTLTQLFNLTMSPFIFINNIKIKLKELVG